MIPKFRAWDKKDKVIREVTAIDWSIDLVEFMNGAIERDIENVEFMQSTGLNDKNGVEIFEGDIFAEGFGRYVVAWEAEGGRWALKLVHDFEDTFYLGMRNSKDMTLIGNIYENPELLEVE